MPVRGASFQLVFTYETGCVVNAGNFFISERNDGSQVAVVKQADVCIQMGCFSGLLVFQSVQSGAESLSLII